MVAKNASLQRTTAAMRFGRSTALSQIALCYRFGQLRIAAKRWPQFAQKRSIPPPPGREVFENMKRFFALISV